jgi:hypothetical protein
MVRLAYYMSIIANLVFVLFLGCLIHNQARTLRWVHDVNPLWFFLVGIVIVVLFAVVAERRSGLGKSKAAGAESQADGSGPATDLAGQTG